MPDDRMDPNAVPLRREREAIVDIETKITGPEKMPRDDPGDLEDTPRITKAPKWMPKMDTEKAHNMQPAPTIAKLYPAVALKKDYNRRGSV